MSKYRVKPTGKERTFDESQIIVSKTDLKGKLTYVNHVFCSVGLYTPAELIGQPHSIVRHPDMPRCVFKLLWDTLQSGNEMFAYVKNMAKNGDHYWVLAHVTPTIDGSGVARSYHSNRRLPDRQAIAAIEPLYARLLAEENRHANDRDGLSASFSMLQETLRGQSQAYDEFIFSVINKAA